MIGAGRARVGILINAYSYSNAGDAAIVISSAEASRTLLGIDQLLVSTRYAEQDRSRYAAHALETVAPLVPFASTGELSQARRLFELVRALSVALVIGYVAPHSRRVALSLAVRWLSPTWAFVAQGAAVVLCGGGYFYSSRRRLNMTLVHAAAQTWLSARLATSVVMMPQSVGPFHRRWDRALVRSALRDVRPLVAREEASLASFGSRPDLALCPDIAFLGLEHSPSQERVAPAFDLALTVMDWRWAGGSDQEYERYLAALRWLLSNAAASGLRVAVTGHSAMPEHAQDDLAVAEALVRSCDEQARRTTVVSSDLDVLALRDLYAASRVVVGTRLHSCIMALAVGSPAVALSYQPKTLGTYSMLGLSSWVRQVRSLDGDGLWETVRGMLDDEPASRHEAAVAVGLAREQIALTYSDAIIWPVKGEA